MSSNGTGLYRAKPLGILVYRLVFTDIGCIRICAPVPGFMAVTCPLATNAMEYNALLFSLLCKFGHAIPPKIIDLHRVIREKRPLFAGCEFGVFLPGFFKFFPTAAIKMSHHMNRKKFEKISRFPEDVVLESKRS